MSTASKRKISTAEAVRRACYILGLEDTKRVGIALAAAGAEELHRNRAFAEQVRDIYTHLAPAPPKQVASRVHLTPIKQMDGYAFNTAAPLDPYFLLEYFGPTQLPDALGLYPVFKLKEGADAVQARNPGTRPANRGQKGSNQ